MKKRQSEKAGGSEMDLKPEYFKLALDDMVAESGVDVLFHSTIFDVVTEGEIVKSVSMVTKSGVLNVEADFFIDATGDGGSLADL